MNGDRWYIHCHHPSWRYGCRTPSLRSAANQQMIERGFFGQTYNVSTNANRNENMSPAISAVGHIDATASAMVV